MKNKQIILGTVLITIFIICAIFAPQIAPHDPESINMAMKNASPSWEYLFGCDVMGRCVFSRVIYGARYSLGFALPVTSILAMIALVLGCAITYLGGLFDRVLGLLCDMFMAFPLIVLAMVMSWVFINPMSSVIVSIGIATVTWFLRMVRSYTKIELSKGYISSARTSGASHFRIIFVHIIPNVIPQYVVYLTTNIASVILGISSFSFLGIGYTAGTPEWGAMIGEAFSSIYTNPSLIVYPGLSLILCCAGFNLLGEGLRDRIGKEEYDSVLGN